MKASVSGGPPSYRRQGQAGTDHRDQRCEGRAFVRRGWKPQGEEVERQVMFHTLSHFQCPAANRVQDSEEGRWAQGCLQEVTAVVGTGSHVLLNQTGGGGGKELSLGPT